MNVRDQAEALGIKIVDTVDSWNVVSGLMCLFPPASSKMINWAEKQTARRIPDSYKEFLGSSNGLFFKDWSLYGISPSLFEGNLLDRDQRQPLCLTLANNDWRREKSYPQESEEWLMIGYIEGETSNIDLFMDHSGIIGVINGQAIEKLPRLESLFKMMTEPANKRSERRKGRDGN